MKLHNKKTGEVVDHISFEKGGGQIFMYVIDTNKDYYYNSLIELNEEWEDAPEEPKEYWCITGRGSLHYLQDITDENDKDHREIGNYFSLQEEAEKAVEKLKAWKRLKDKGFRFYDYRFLCNDGEPHYIEIKARIDDISDPANKYARDLRLLFGGEE